MSSSRLQILWPFADVSTETAKTPSLMSSSPTPQYNTDPHTIQVACEHLSQTAHCNTCRSADAEVMIQDVIQELTERAVNNTILRGALFILEDLLDQSRQAEAMCQNMSVDWIEHKYTYAESQDATEFISHLQKLIGLALSFSSQSLCHDPHRAIKLIRLRHDAAITALSNMLLDSAPLQTTTVATQQWQIFF
jgi:hypothetical protein